MTRPQKKTSMELQKVGLAMTLIYFDALFCGIHGSWDFPVLCKSTITCYMGVILPASPSTCTDPEGAILDPESSCSSVDLPAPESYTYDLQGWISYVIVTGMDFTKVWLWWLCIIFFRWAGWGTCECCCLDMRIFINPYTSRVLLPKVIRLHKLSSTNKSFTHLAR